MPGPALEAVRAAMPRAIGVEIERAAGAAEGVVRRNEARLEVSRRTSRDSG